MKIQIESMREDLSKKDPTDLSESLEWDSITLEQFKKEHIWTDGNSNNFICFDLFCYFCVIFHDRWALFKLLLLLLLFIFYFLLIDYYFIHVLSVSSLVLSFFWGHLRNDMIYV